MSRAEHYRRLIDDVHRLARQCGREPKDITVVVASKFQPIEAVHEVFEAGCIHFGESRVQEALPKIAQGDPRICWHFLGTLQKNKVNKIIGKFSLIHSLDSPELAQALSQASMERQTLTHVLLQVNTSGEATKHGLSPEEWTAQLDGVLDFPGICVEGLMTMAPLVEDPAIIHRCFADLRRFKERIEARTGQPLRHLSMGMTHDYPIAIAEGATLLRIGTAVWTP